MANQNSGASETFAFSSWAIRPSNEIGYRRRSGDSFAQDRRLVAGFGLGWQAIPIMSIVPGINNLLSPTPVSPPRTFVAGSSKICRTFVAGAQNCPKRDREKHDTQDVIGPKREPAGIPRSLNSSNGRTKPKWLPRTRRVMRPCFRGGIAHEHDGPTASLLRYVRPAAGSASRILFGDHWIVFVDPVQPDR